MSRRTKNESTHKLISIISTLLERQEKLYCHISDLEDYIDALESIGFSEDSEVMDGGMMIEFVPDEKMKQVLDEGLTKEQKEKIEEIKRNKIEQKMHSMDDILKVFEKDKDDSNEDGSKEVE